MKTLTFEQLPDAIASISDKLEIIERLILSRELVSQIESDELLTVKDAAILLKLSVPTIYGLISKGELPVMKRSKRCYFSKQELITYVKEGRKMTKSEVEQLADKQIRRKGV